jgi:hypothetical protein|tara:strand:+ start:444 stop:923 length:480 start_codon:yes stop_codon:yes gene_type:complete
MTDYQYVTKLIKLANGDDVVGEVDIASLKTSEIKVKNPQRIVTLTNQTHMGMAFVKWVPWNYGDRIPVNKRHVVTVCNTHPVVLDYYKKTNDKIKNYKPRTKVEAAANAITGMEEPEEPDGASAQLERIIDKLAKGEESSKLDEIMDELNDPDKKITFH